MSVKYKVGDNELSHFITFSIIEWIDALTRNEYKDIIVESLKHCITLKGLRLNAWIIMSNHLHLIMSASKDLMIGDILRDFKKFTSKQIFNAIKENPKESRREWMIYMFERAGKRNSNNKDFQFWNQDNHPIELSTPLMLKQRLDYLHENPVRAGIVFEPQDYVYSSACDYYGNRKGMIEIEHLQC
jgi:REP element-mobilizing transposase RayT